MATSGLVSPFWWSRSDPMTAAMASRTSSYAPEVAVAGVRIDTIAGFGAGP